MENLVKIDPGLIVWTVVTFVVLLLILRWKAWGPIVVALEKRERTIRESIDAAKREREEAQRLVVEHRQTIDQARKDTARMIEQGRKDAETARAEMLEKSRHEAHEILEQGRRQIERETRAAVQELRSGGYLPAAVRNYLALLGWGADDDQTILSTEQLVEQFSIERVGRSSAVFGKARSPAA